MSDQAAPQGALPDGASGTPAAPPASEPVTPPVAPTPVASAPADTTDWKARFDGLMSAFNKQQEQLKAAQQVPASVPKEAASDQDSDMSARVAQLEALVIQQQNEAAKKQAIALHPEIAPLVDFLVGETPEDILELASEIATRLKPAESQGAGAEGASAPPAATPTVPVTAGAPPFTSSHVDDELTALRAEVRAKKPGAFGKLMQAMFERQQMAQQ